MDPGAHEGDPVTGDVHAIASYWAWPYVQHVVMMAHALSAWRAEVWGCGDGHMSVNALLTANACARPSRAMSSRFSPAWSFAPECHHGPPQRRLPALRPRYLRPAAGWRRGRARR